MTDPQPTAEDEHESEADLTNEVGNFWLKVADFIGKLSVDLEISGDVLLGLPNEDDWSFVVKTHALIETAIAHLLTQAIGRGELAEFFGYLPLQGRNGKIKAADDLGLLSREQIAYASVVANLRNRLVHSARNWTFSFEALFAEDPAALTRIAVAVFGEKASPHAVNATRRHPKFVLFLPLMKLLAHVYETSKTANLEREAQELNTQFVESMHADDEYQ